MFLVLTGLEINLLKDKKYELLGEWIKECKPKDYWIKKKVKTFRNPWNNKEKLLSDYKYLEIVHKNLLIDLSSYLNKINKVNKSKRYWQTLLDPWLLSYIAVIYERWLTLENALKKHDIFKYHPAATSGMCHSYCGFPVRNKDGYALGTFCLLNFTEVKEISSEKIELVEKLVSRLALQIDTQTEQKELTSQKISKSIDVFLDSNSEFQINDYKSFIDICSGLNLPKENAVNLIKNGLCELKNNAVILSSIGNDLQEKMNIFTKVHNQIKVEGNEANTLIDNALDKLGEL